METLEYEINDFPETRLATTDVGRFGLKKHSMIGLLEVDVTRARQAARALRQTGQGPSFTAWMIKAIGNCIAQNKQVQAMRIGMRKLIMFHDVDIAIPVERPVGRTGVPLPLLIKGTNRKSVLEIQKELEAAASREISDERDYILGEHEFSITMLRLYYRLLQFLRLLVFRYLFGSPFRARKHSGTALVTTVNAAGEFGGWIVPMRGLHNISIGMGAIVRKPWVVDQAVKIREILHMTITLNHDVIDGVPARRFIQELVGVIEKGELEPRLQRLT